ncbi:hypothetical protein L195_g023606 [Trifolium pratense]|uniref:Uncharacterized protein n=1 Tax=Trifolium pratense TaxID=57577 RepID=A0A2K3NBB0_TRIPR|nr:hypothetical protein L195_g023606 [Trifolium pratense]
MTSINFTINSVSVLNPKLNHHNARHSLLHSPTFHPFLKQNRTFKPSLQKPLTVTFVAPQHDSDHGEVEVEKGNMLEQLKIQVDKVTHALDAVTKKFITEEGNESFSYTTAKEIIETFSIPVDDLFSNVSGIRDFYVGIPYGYILSWGGFLSFMITGSIAAISLMARNSPLEVNKWEIPGSNPGPAHKMQYPYQLSYAQGDDKII